MPNSRRPIAPAEEDVLDHLEAYLEELGESDLLTRALLCSTLLISESRFDGVFERFSSRFAVEFSSELERSEILCEAIF
ncbi:hypothetical protein SAMN06266787_10839 [Halorubrum ezzemoulense]|uniref:Uncharacterized protein n=1 Tax=Halorubrum ezzemoulense TaxID=337243 RepID=A0A238Y476_HALEZ|nr:hypothetical protein SAMN06266787_10839 [Halorubrum ezzemoulense]